ncbi:MAG: glucose 1-dehydrogenase [Sedimentisphaerales bacterium]|nr:glucose 1-dehydrogenase [Sedimentisphaerales bacterium]
MEVCGLRNKVALITGGSSGLGRETAIAFAKAGAKVVIADVDAHGGEETAKRIADQGSDVLFVKADVSKSNHVEQLIRQVVKTYGRLDCAHNNAGIEGELAKTGDCSEDNWNNVIETNLKSAWLCLKFEIRQMVQQASGVIVNTSSVYGLVGSERGLPAYVASKHGIIGLTKTAALEYACLGIRVNAVCPGAIDTPFRDRLVEKNHEKNLECSQRYPIGRIGRPDEVANAVVWLCSEAASYITGSVLTIDGGLTAK